MKGLVWFRSDLRTDDNPALKSAFEQCDEVIAIYLYSPIQAALHNESNIKNDFIIKNGDRIAQIVIAKHERAIWEECNDLSKTKRGSGGFGSTGQK